VSEKKYKDIIADTSNFETSLTKLLGKNIVDIKGYFTSEFGDSTFKATALVLEDGTEMGFEGEHDLPYIVEYLKYPQDNFDGETLLRLLDEQNNHDRK
jgi:hypothetical protein